ncbi:MAG: uroporphyrinogen-III C-methyltransferase [bacterium]
MKESKRNKKGKVYLVGAGPGDPGLITIRGKEIIQGADVIIYDRLVNPALLESARSGCERIFCRRGVADPENQQLKINELMLTKAMEGRTVVRLKGGDALLFGRGAEEAEYLIENGIACEIVPGITSALAVPTCAGIPLTHRLFSSSVAIVTGHRKRDYEHKPQNWEKLASAVDTIVILMGVSNLPSIVDELLRHGKKEDTPVAIIEWGTTPKQKIVTGNLGNIVSTAFKNKIAPPAVIVIGEVVKLHKKIKNHL